MWRRIYRAQNSPVEVSGLDLVGVVVAVIGGLISMIKFGPLWGLVGGMPGWMIGNIVSDLWYKGETLRKCYWKLPVSGLLGGRKLPPSCIRRFM